jgi:hypothetical protein
MPVPANREEAAMSQMLKRALRAAGQWLSELVEAFPIPIEDILWVERCGQSVATNGTVVRRIGRPPGR